MADIPVVSMERTAAEKKAAKERYNSPPDSDVEYPWGLCINLGKDEIKKLGLKDLPDVGEEVTICAVCTVTRVSQSASLNATDEDSQGVELQITHMGLVEGADADEGEGTPMGKAAQKLYGK